MSADFAKSLKHPAEELERHDEAESARHVECWKCGGDGVETYDQYDGSVVNPCERCGGSGHVPTTSPDQSSWPAHLRDDAPYQRCDRCRRKTWDRENFEGHCTMPQWDGAAWVGQCGGQFRSESQ